MLSCNDRYMKPTGCPKADHIEATELNRMVGQSFIVLGKKVPKPPDGIWLLRSGCCDALHACRHLPIHQTWIDWRDEAQR